MNKNTRNVIKVLQKLSENAFDLSQYYSEKGNSDQADREIKKSICYDVAIHLLNNKNYLKELARIYEIELEK